MGVRARPRTQSSLAIRGGEGPWFLVNASPDARQQLEALTPGQADGVRAPPIATVLLTDAEIDHTAGLLLLRESQAPVRVFGSQGVEQALRRGYPVLEILERYCGAEWQTLEPERVRHLEGSSLTVEPFETGGDAPRYLDGSDVLLQASGFVFRDSASGGVMTYVPGLARLDDGVLSRLAACDVVLVDGTFWRDDELAQLGISTRSARDMGHLPLSGTRRDPRGARAARATAQGARAHQQHEPDPARGLSRAGGGASRGRRCCLRWPRDRAMTETATRRTARRAVAARGVRRPPARAGDALPQPAPLPQADGRWRAHARGAAALGREPLLLPEVHPLKDAAILSNCPEVEVRREWIRRIIDHDGTTDGTGGIESWLRLGEALGVSRDELVSERRVLPAVRYAVDAYVNFARQKPWIEAVASSLTELFGPAAIRVRLEALERHYEWIDPAGLEYFRTRLVQAPRDAQYALDLTVERCRTREQQEAAVAALRFKTEMLWAQLEAIERGDTQPPGPDA